MKKTRRFAAIAAAAVMTAALAVPMSMSSFAAEHSVTITAKDNATHSYEAYQIFSGTYAGGVLTEIQWGSGVDSTALLTALQADTTLGTYFEDCKTASDVADALGATVTAGEGDAAVTTATFEDDAALTQAFVKVVGANLSTTKSGTVEGNKITGLSDGYYFVKDASAPVLVEGEENSGAYTRYIVKVTDDADITVEAKSAAPSVDKQVWDEEADAEDGAVAGWGESADHAINETFQFKLIATLPASTEYDAYETYKLVFNDTMSAGVTFEQIDEVTVDGVKINASDYVVSGVAEGEAGKTWSLAIADIKKFTGVDLKDGADVVVTYSAHLNENAVISSVSGTNLGVDATNNNKVGLEYSNNPNWKIEWEKDHPDQPDGPKDEDEELGETPEDYVWVFTYKAFNTKLDQDKAPLADAEFGLYSDEACETEISLIYDENLLAYRPVKDGETATVMKSAETTGIFNIAGLDVGTYYLKETKAPVGYNLLTTPTAFAITATHAEDESDATVSLTLDGNASEDEPLTIENKKGSSLPSTGGIGTTLFYVVGGTLVAGAGVTLITKKRIKDSNK